MLLGREKETPGWRLGSNRWSAFSGKVDSDEDLVAAATREFREETLALVPLSNPEERAVPGARETYSDATNALRRALPLENFFSSRNEACRHVTFIAEVRYDDYPRQFSELRAELLKAEGVFQRYNRRRTLYADRVPSFCIPGTRVSQRVAVRDVRLVDEAVEVQLWDEQDNSGTLHLFQVPPCVHRYLLALCACWRAVVRFVEDNRLGSCFAHPAVRVCRVHGNVTQAYVDRSFLEKSEVRWFSLTDLRLVCRNKGLHREQFRPHFLDFLHCITCSLDSLTGGRGEDTATRASLPTFRPSYPPEHLSHHETQ